MTKTKVAPFYLGHAVESRQHSTLNDANSTYTYKPILQEFQQINIID